MKSKILCTVAGFGLLATSSLQADLTLTLSDGTHNASYSDASTPGSITLATGPLLGNWLVYPGAVASFLYGSQYNPLLSFNDQITAAGGNTTTLTVTLTESGLIALPTGTNADLISYLQNKEANPSARINISQMAEINGTQVGSANTLTYTSGGGYPNVANSTVDTTLSSGLDSTYSLTEVFTITGTGTSTIQLGQLNLVPAPEPGSDRILVGALLILPFAAKFLRRRQVS